MKKVLMLIMFTILLTSLIGFAIAEDSEPIVGCDELQCGEGYVTSLTGEIGSSGCPVQRCDPIPTLYTTGSEDNEKEPPMLGSSCGTVTPGYQNECCVNKGYDRWNSEEWKCTNENKGEVSGKGVIKFVNVEGGCWKIVSNDGVSYEATNLDEKYKQDGLEVKFEGVLREDVTSVCQVGTLIEIVSMVYENETDIIIIGNSCGSLPLSSRNQCCKNKGAEFWDESAGSCVEKKIACTKDTKVCPDGIIVKRTGDNCEFRCLKQVNISKEKVCCKVYGYGEGMSEVNVRYKIIEKKACALPKNFVGGNIEIVNNSYCIDQIKESRQEFIDKKWEIMQERNRIKAQYKNQSECPESCSCSGSTVKCEFENGTRVMTITAGKSGNVIVQVKNINASTNVTLYKADGKVYGIFKNNETHQVILPDEVKDRIKEIEKDKKGRAPNLTDENITLNETGSYHIEGKKHARLFWIIPIKEKVQYEVNSETGDITKTKAKWWGFLARDVREKGNSTVN